MVIVNMYKKLTRKEVTAVDIKEIFEFLLDVGWWNLIALDNMQSCAEAYEWTKDLFDEIKGNED